jgi:hypothetical protein
MKTEMPNLEAAALDCLARGFFIFPLRPQMKIPLAGSKGFLDATNDEFQIHDWWKENPAYNVGVSCGASDLCVLDFDSAAPPADLPPTFTVRTSKGVHKYFRGARKSGKMLGGDVKSEGGYVLAAGSVHPDGRTYTIVDDCSIAPLPEGFRLSPAPARTFATTDGRIPIGSRHAYLVFRSAQIRNITPPLTREAMIATLTAEAEAKCDGAVPLGEIVGILNWVEHKEGGRSRDDS